VNLTVQRRHLIAALDCASAKLVAESAVKALEGKAE
jgi:hypothetical protein